MNAKLTVIRALSFVLARRVLRIATIITAVSFVIVVILTWILAAQLSAWWWLLLVPTVAALIIITTILLIANLIARSLYRAPLSSAQSKKLTAFADKIQRIAESRGLGWPMLVFLSIKDLFVYRELRTIIDLASDVTSLRQDFKELEQLLQ